MAIFTLLFWGFSSACFGDTILIRMYMMQTVQILALIAYHIKKSEKNVYHAADALELIALVAFGGLTHYYFYIFAAAFGACVCLYLLLNKKYTLLAKYASSLWLGVAVACIVFPATLTRHIFGYRGSYALGTISRFNIGKFGKYLKMINSALYGNTLGLFAAAVLIYVVIQLASRYFTSKNNRTGKNWLFGTAELQLEGNNLLLMFTVIASVAFFYVAVQGSEVVNIRYIYAIYPLTALITEWLLSHMITSETGRGFCALLAIAIALLSVQQHGIDWAYQDYNLYKSKADALANYDCVIVCQTDKWCNVLQAFNVYVNMDEIRAVDETNLSDLQEILDERSTKSEPVCISFLSFWTDDEREALLNDILKHTDYTTYELSYDYYTPFDSSTTIYTLS